MNGFRCKVTNATSTVPLGTPKVARRCGADPDNGKLQAAPANCTYGPKAPFFWFNNERNNMFEGTFSPPVYNDRYNFLDGAQDDIFVDSYLSIPTPAPNAAMPIAADVSAKFPIASPANSSDGSAPAARSCASMAGGASRENIRKREHPVEGHSVFSAIGMGVTRRHARRLDPKNRNRLWNMW